MRNDNSPRSRQAPVQEALGIIAGIIVTLAVLLAYRLLVGQGHPYLIGLFPVALIAIFLSSVSASVSLAITAVFIFVYETQPNPILPRILYCAVFIIEGAVLIWLITSRKRARSKLAAAVRQREGELARLRAAHDRLREDTTKQNQSLQQLQASNRIMLETLERILGNSNRRS